MVLTMVTMVFFISVISLSVLSAVASDPCDPNNHFTFPLYLGERNERCKAAATGPLQCDRFLIPNWYVTPDAYLLNTCPSSGDCGVSYPAWMDGSFPAIDDGIVSRNVCVKVETDCCSQKVDIQVKNCGGFVVYFLNRLPFCYSVYCFESELPCFDGTTSTTNAVVNTTNLPPLVTTPWPSAVPSTKTTSRTVPIPAFTASTTQKITDHTENKNETSGKATVISLVVLSVLLLIAALVIAKMFWFRSRTEPVYDTKVQIMNDAPPAYEELNFKRKDGKNDFKFSP